MTSTKNDHHYQKNISNPPLPDGHHKCMVPKFNKNDNIAYLEKRYQRREPSVFTSDGLSLE